MIKYIIIAVVFLALISLFIVITKRAALSTRNMILVALFAALSAIGAYIRVPIPYVPFTMQVFFCILSGVFLGAELGMMSQLVYVLLGLCGAPVFTEGSGPAYIFHKTFGYLIGFILAAYLVGKLLGKFKKMNILSIFTAGLAGVAVIYIFGVPYLYVILNIYQGIESFTMLLALAYGFAATIGGDLISVFLVSLTAHKLLPVLSRSNLLPIPADRK